MTQDLISKWLDDGLITEKQAAVMREDLLQSSKEKTSQGIITSVSTIGALLLGLGSLLFIAANWQEMSNQLRVIVLLASTLTAFYTGYFLRYQKQSFPRVGEALLFLSTGLIGATLFLIAQMYHWPIQNHLLIGLWIILIAPVVYLVQTTALSTLFMALFYAWLAFFAFRNLAFSEASNAFVALPVLFVNVSIMVFMLGGFHFWKEEWKNMGRIYRLAALQLGFLGLFLLTFRSFSGIVDSRLIVPAALAVYGQFSFTILGFSAVALLSSLAYLFYNPTHRNTYIFESGIGVMLLVFTTIFLYTPRSTSVFTFVFNAVLSCLIGFALIEGYKREDMKLINISTGYLTLFLIARYFDFFWDILPRSAFFLIGGAALTAGGIILEKQLKTARAAFAQSTKKGSHV